jgi:hypothetical protein
MIIYGRQSFNFILKNCEHIHSGKQVIHKQPVDNLQETRISGQSCRRIGRGACGKKCGPFSSGSQIPFSLFCFTAGFESKA